MSYIQSKKLITSSIVKLVDFGHVKGVEFDSIKTCKQKIPPTGGNRRAGHEVLTNRETYQYLYFITPSCDKKGVLSL